MKSLLALIALIALINVTSASADIFAYKTDDGVFSYTDDRGKIPAKYRAGATVVPTGKDAKPMITVVTPDADLVTMRQASRLRALRESNDADRRAASEAKAKIEAAEAAKPDPTIIIIQPRVERHGFPQRNRHKGA